MLRLNLGVLRLHRGRLQGAEALLRDARRRLLQQEIPSHVATADGNLGNLCWAEGRLDEAVSLLETSCAALPDTFMRRFFSLCLACVWAVSGDLAAAKDEIEALEAQLGDAPADPLGSCLAIAWATVDVASPAPERARVSALERLRALPTPDVFSTFQQRICLRTLPGAPQRRRRSP